MKRGRFILACLLSIAVLVAPAAAQTTQPAKPAARTKPAKRAPRPKPQRKPNWRQIEQARQAHNAARQDKGGRVSVEFISDDAGIDRNTHPQSAADGNFHSRCVLWGQYRYRIDLVAAMPVTEISFICSDGAGEASPESIEIHLSDETVIPMTLEVKRPSRANRQNVPRQTVEIGKTLEWIEVTVLSTYPGAVNAKTGTPRPWGGLGEIEVITTADLAPYLVVPDFNADAATYVEGGSPRNDYSDVTVTLPTPIESATRPGIYLSRTEILRMRERMRQDPRAAEMLAKLIRSCNQWLNREIVHPDPKAPAQMKSRFDAAAKAHGLMSKMAGWLGWAYQLTDDERYAVKAREILVGYARLYPDDYKEHKGVHSGDTSKVMAQRLSEAMWLLPLIQGYDLIYHAECMSVDDRRLIETDLIRHALAFINKRSAADEVARRDGGNPQWRTAPPAIREGAVGNWMNFYNAAYIQGGIVMDDQNWIDIGAADTRFMVANGIGADGMWGEGAIGYQFFARHALVACLEPLARNGIDVWSFMDCRFKNLFDSPLKYAYPDGTAPGINDSGRSAVGGSWTAMAYDFAYLRYGDPNYGSLVNAAPRQVFQSSGCYFPTVIYEKLPERPMAGLGSLIFESLGYGILRGRDNGGGTFALMDYGPHGGGHGHPDKLNLILFADGDELAGEPQGYAYEERLHTDWQRPSIAHWTMSVDMHQQAATTGKLLAFYDAGDIKVMRGQAGGGYAGVALDRTVVQMPGYIVDIYRGWGQGEHTFDYPLCFRGSLDALEGVDPETLKPMGPPTQRGYKHILCTPPIEDALSWSGVWVRAAGEGDREAEPPDERRKHPANTVRVTVLSGDTATVFTGIVPGGRHQAVVRQHGSEAVFAAIIDPFRGSDAVEKVENLALTSPVAACGVKVTRADGGTDLIIVRYDQQIDAQLAAATTFDGGATNALVAVIRLDPRGNVTRMGMVGGTRLSCGPTELTSDAPGIAFTP